MRGWLPTIGTISRLTGFVAIAAAIVAASIHFRRVNASAKPPVAVVALSASSDALARCRTIGLVAKDDTACEAAWAENRRHFFTYRPIGHAMSEPPADRPAAAAPGDK